MVKRDLHALARLAAIAALVPLAFAAPALLGLDGVPRAPGDEAQLGRAMLRAFGGLSLPIVAAVVVAFGLGRGSPLRARLDRAVAAGLAPSRAAPRATLLVAAVVPALVAAATVIALRLARHLGGGALVAQDAAGSAWGVFLGGAAWAGLAALLVARSGRGMRAYWLLGIELPLRLAPGAAAWLSPSAHLGNLLGAPPPRGFVPVPVIPQWVSVLALLVVAIAATAGALRRYRAAAPS
jgi:hypothetical protein